MLFFQGFCWLCTSAVFSKDFVRSAPKNAVLPGILHPQPLFFPKDWRLPCLHRGLSEYCLECPLSIGSSIQRHRIWRVLQCFASATLLLGWGLFWRAFSLGVSPFACSWDYMTWKGFWEKCVHYPTCSSNSAWKAEQHLFCGVCWSFSHHLVISWNVLIFALCSTNCFLEPFDRQWRSPPKAQSFWH